MLDALRCFDGGVTDTERVERAIQLAAELLRSSKSDETGRERRRRRRLGRLVSDADGRELTLALTDQVLRIDDRRRAARRFADLVGEHARPEALGALDSAMLAAGARLAPLLPGVVMPLVERRILAEAHGVVLAAEDPAFTRHVARRRAEGVRLNINVLGEAILSDAEADRRTELLRRRIARPDVDYISVKLSAIVANLDVYAFDHSVSRICDRLRRLYRDAEAATPVTFVNLDMEEYGDLELTGAAFTTVLDEPEFECIDAGIVLQAYLPDSHAALEHLGQWAAARRARSGGRIKVRLVKGANLDMEQAEAELHGWNQAPYPTKADVDASFKSMLESALRPEWADAVRVGVASHNLFDVAWAWVLASDTIGDRAAVTDRIDFEMLEGMAPDQARQVQALTNDLLLYAPVVERSDIDASVAYLSRRLDENTAPENFLRALFDMRPGDAEWARQAQRFRTAVAARHEVSKHSRRDVLPSRPSGFSNEPETDLTRPAARAEVYEAMASTKADEPPVTETIEAIDEIVERAAASTWGDLTPAERRRTLDAVADLMVAERATTLAVMADEAAKTVHEGDPEVSEAIDFARYYGAHWVELLDRLADDGVTARPRGVVAVLSPWNFPYAIPTGGVCAALAAGNPVILKPPPETRRTAYWLAQQLWRAGVPDDALQFVAVDDGPVGRHLVTHPGLDSVVLTGSYDTARMFLDWKPTLRLLAETSGKNALVITAAADIDAAIGDLVRSAFGHAGQKCSAASLAIVDHLLYDEGDFLDRLRDAVESLVVGDAADPRTMMGPLIRVPEGPLQRALTTLDHGECWLVQPRQLDDTGLTWSPGVRVGVAPGSWFHQTECFGPVLGVMRADDLDHAIELQNGVEYGLTGGIHSLDPNEVDRWIERVQAGNAYVNRHITGAVVQRQPFGGWKRSSIGAGAKAGGPGYVSLFASFDHAVDLSVDEARASYGSWWAWHFTRLHDPSELAVERNALRYLPLRRVLVRYDGSTAGEDLELVRHAARVAGVAVELSSSDDETDDELAGGLGVAEHPDRLRLLAPAAESLLRACHEADVAVDTAPVSRHGRVELAHWVREQAISETAHRYGRRLISTGVDRLGPA
ncbi:bifunctional proline dehydrogenase/L-glutamate gamma-semialdehyde dehydrogenase [soil metagenome]